MSSRSARRRVPAISSAGLLACALATAEEFRVPRPGASFAAGTTVEAAWTAPCDRQREDEGELVLSLDDGLTFPIRLTGEMPACISAHRWRVPDLTASRARLGLRRGRNGQRDEERIVLVSARFKIVGGASADDTGLTRGAMELWTHQALAEFEAEDLLSGHSLGREPEWSEHRAAGDEAEDPGPGALRVFAPTSAGLASLPVSRSAVRREAVFRVPFSVPLRL